MLQEDWLQQHLWPLFSQVRSRDEIYLANHSLGRPPDRMAKDVKRALDLWYAKMDDAWDPWMAEMNTWRGNIAKLLGYSRPDCIVPKTSAGQGLRAVLNSFPQDRPLRVVTTRGEFDSIDFVLKTYAQRGRAEVTWVEASGKDGPVPTFAVAPLIEALSGEPGLVVASLVFFGTSQILQDVDELIAAAHERGWLVLLDVYHAAGVIPLALEELGADFAIGGSYKYLRGGPGACYLAIHPRHLSSDSPLRSLDTGWFAKRNTFGYQRGDEAQFAEGGDGWLESTPPVLMPFQAKAGLELTLALKVEALRGHSLELQSRMRAAFLKEGVRLVEPSDPARYGAYSLLHRLDAAEFSKKLKAAGVNTDARGPFVRFGPDALTSGEELERAAKIVAGV